VKKKKKISITLQKILCCFFWDQRNNLCWIHTNYHLTQSLVWLNYYYCAVAVSAPTHLPIAMSPQLVSGNLQQSLRPQMDPQCLWSFTSLRSIRHNYCPYRCRQNLYLAPNRAILLLLICMVCSHCQATKHCMYQNRPRVGHVKTDLDYNHPAACL